MNKNMGVETRELGVENFILRIASSHGTGREGLIESVQETCIRPFKSVQELHQILASSHDGIDRRKKARPVGFCRRQTDVHSLHGL